MKVKDLLGEINECIESYGQEFLDWDVYTEQLDEEDKEFKRDRGWQIIKDSEDWEYFECAGFWTKNPNKKIFTVNVNF